MRRPLELAILGSLVVACGTYAAAQSWPWRSMAIAAGPSRYPPFVPQYAPDPDNLWSFVQDGSKPSFLVPPGRDLVITELCVDGNWQQSFLTINGAQLGISWPLVAAGATVVFDPGFVAHPGDLVDFAPTSTNAHFVAAAGYFASRYGSPLTVRVPFIPRPLDVVFIDLGVAPFSYTVPPGEHLILREGVGALTVNGTLVWEFHSSGGGLSTPYAPALRSGIVANPGDVLTGGWSYSGFLRR